MKTKNIHTRYCFKCNAEIQRLDIALENKKPEEDMWDGAIVEKITGGYGSKHDCSVFIIAICDKCLDENVEKLEFRGNYAQGYKEG